MYEVAQVGQTISMNIYVLVAQTYQPTVNGLETMLAPGQMADLAGVRPYAEGGTVIFL
jgi:hypothetical protein